MTSKRILKMKNWYQFALSMVIGMMAMAVSAQTSSIRGSVIEEATGDAVINAGVMVVGSQLKAITDLDGKFEIKAGPGIYTLRIDMFGLDPLTVEGVEVKAGQVTVLENLLMSSGGNMLKGATVSAAAIRNNESALALVRKNSSNLIDGISASSFKRIGDGDAAGSIKRVSGVSVTGGKYVYVRGLGDRYTKSTLNGVDIPGVDPDRNSVQMDLFPTSVLDNIIVHKSFVAELPADFTGGVVDLATKDFPTERVRGISIGGNYNPNFHFNPNWITYEGRGATDFLGFDDGTRAIPATDDIPNYVQAISDPERRARYEEILGAFNPIMATSRAMSLMDMSFGFNMGDQIKKDDQTLGYIAVFNYKNEYNYFDSAVYGRFGMNENTAINDLEAREYQTGSFGSQTNSISAMLGLAKKTQVSKYRMNILHLQSGESKAGFFNYENSDQGAEFVGEQHNLEYSQRSVTNVLISGKHQRDVDAWEIEWKISPTLSTMYDPDIRFTRYEKRPEYYIGTEAGFPQRIWRNILEVNFFTDIHARKNTTFRGNPAKVKTGVLFVNKRREFNLLNFNLNIRGNLPLTGDPNELFSNANIWPRGGDMSSGTTFEAAFLPRNPNQFYASVVQGASYVSAEIEPTDRLKVTMGLRGELFQQRYTGQNQLGTRIMRDELVLNDLDLFPSLNMVYSLNEKNNVRASFTQTIARPSFKEMSFAEIYDPLTGRTFIGGFFADVTANGDTIWNGNLQSTNITNVDFRWETFMGPGQTLSLGAFGKYFENPIEIVQFVVQAGAFQPRNVGNATVFGGEIEFRQNLKSLGMPAWELSGNASWVESSIMYSATEKQSREDNARDGQVIGDSRPMAGQAPYMINTGIAYNSRTEQGLFKGMTAGLYYNVQGKTLQYVGIADRPDVYSMPFHSLNFSMNKTFGPEDRMSLGLKVNNLLDDEVESVFSNYGAQDEVFTWLWSGRQISASFSYKF